MLVRLLGAVEIAQEDGWTRAGPAKQSCVLAALTLDAPHAVGVHTLIDRIWGFAQPETANGTLYSYVARLRAALRHDPRVRVERADGEGYRLDIAAELVDVFVMRDLASRATALDAAGDRAAALPLWRQAAGLWRGGPLAGLEGEWAQQTRKRLREECLTVAAARFAAEAHAGHHGQIIEELRTLFRAYPREPLAHCLMEAFAVTNRADEALGCFEVLARHLRESGEQPSAELEEWRDKIAAGANAALPGMTQPAVPAQLPATTSTFLGRDQPLRDLRAGRADSTVLCIDGMAGIGKTALAVHTAQSLATEYPDGQLFIDLHGHSSGTGPVTPSDALVRLLVALGTPATEVPAHLEDQAALYRTTLAGRRLIVVLDNAHDERQVVPLLPGTPESLVLVTSRRRMAGLDDVRAISLDVLTREDAAALFTSAAGDFEASGDVIESIVELCGRLPLAIRIAAARLRSRRHWTPETLLRKLSTSPQPLAELEVGQRSVVAAFAVSYEELDEEHRRLFRLLGLVRGSDVSPLAAAALSDTTVERAEDMLDALTDAHLLISTTPGRYRFHDLIGHFAAETSSDETSHNIQVALTRLLNGYALAAVRAAKQLDPHLAPDLPAAIDGEGQAPAIASRDEAMNWLDTERANLVAAVERGAEWDIWPHTVVIADTLGYATKYRGYFLDQLTISAAALRCARAHGDATAESLLLSHTALALRKLQRVSEARETYEQALAIASEHDAPHATAIALNGLGNLHGDYAESVSYLHRTIELATRTGHDALRATAHVNCAPCHVDLREYAKAATHLDEAQRLFEALGHDEERVRVDHHRARLLRAQGRVEESLPLQEKAARFCRDTRATGLGYVLRELAVTRRQLGDTAGARAALLEAKEFAESGFVTMLSSISIELGHVSRAEGDYDAAIAHYERAQQISHQHSHTHEHALSHQALAEAHRDRDDRERARAHYRAAMHWYTRTGLPAADDIRAQLEALGDLVTALAHVGRDAFLAGFGDFGVTPQTAHRGRSGQ